MVKTLVFFKRGSFSLIVGMVYTEAIEGYLHLGYSVSQTAEACGVSRSVLYSRMQQLGISYRDRFSCIDNNSLDAAVTDIKMNHPNCGEVLIIGHLRARGIIVQQSRMGLADLLYFVNAVTTIHPKLCQICSSVQSVSREDHPKYELKKKKIINQLLQEFVNAHSHHSISTENNLTPLQLFNNNQHLLSLHSVTPQQDLRAANLPRRHPICNPLSDEFYRNLCQEIDPLMNISRYRLVQTEFLSALDTAAEILATMSSLEATLREIEACNALFFFLYLGRNEPVRTILVSDDTFAIFLISDRTIPVSDRLTDNLERDAHEWDKEENFDKAPSH
ncbi:hypothetical protein P5673_014430 [Acropora cervicornis]|uniref:Uncharacterized protein n=1 Tax=Acropora cervicornis TaxID=6130 RepID=A0AAD9QJY3_ACRCE|nr:hypothetical protein P5673_014430 [Acropora cervicornis]